MDNSEIKKIISDGKTSLGIEFGSTRIKAVLIGTDHSPLASGSFDWENRLENGIWTYHLDDVWTGLQKCYRNLADNVKNNYGVTLKKIGALGFSAMMHGYLAFDNSDNQLAEFRTWRNTSTEEAASKLTAQFEFNIPQRWSIAHLYQAMLNNEEQVKKVNFITTLAGYVHWHLTGKKVLGIGDASGMFPINSEKMNYNAEMMEKFDKISIVSGYSWRLSNILPKVLMAGENAGFLTEKGALLIDPTGELEAGVPLAPPEGDAGTGMTATNSVAEQTGNVSAGTSVFAMIVLEKALNDVYTEIDMVTTPNGKPVAMVHCNNCSSDIDAWAGLMKQFANRLGCEISTGKALDTLFFSALNAEPDCGGIVTCNYYSGEPITELEGGRPLVARLPKANFTLPNFARSLLYSAMATLKIGMDILITKEKVTVTKLLGHGGFFKAKGVGQQILAAALKTPTSVMETAGEGGPWGMALLAAFMLNKSENQTLDEYLNDKVFSNAKVNTIMPNAEDCNGFEKYLVHFKACLEAEKVAVKFL